MPHSLADLEAALDLLVKWARENHPDLMPLRVVFQLRDRSGAVEEIRMPMPLWPPAARK